MEMQGVAVRVIARELVLATINFALTKSRSRSPRQVCCTPLCRVIRSHMPGKSTLAHEKTSAGIENHNGRGRTRAPPRAFCSLELLFWFSRPPLHSSWARGRAATWVGYGRLGVARQRFAVPQALSPHQNVSQPIRGSPILSCAAALRSVVLFCGARLARGRHLRRGEAACQQDREGQSLLDGSGELVVRRRARISVLHRVQVFPMY
ncbi:hypothetical protein BC834DRAFT_893001 [Gloeopeniophorella convolvens]|nr:hypothetical protein BC834DRAFT_893001 [Gloeopeniophorella convolvens]